MTKQKAKENSEESVMHVMLANPVYVRKEVLRTAIDATKLQKYFEDTKETREKKVIYLDRLNKKMGDLSLLAKNLHHLLPKVEEEKKEVKKEIKPIVKPEIKKPVVAKPKLPPAPQKSKIDLELEEIEKKLENIKI